LTSLFDVQIGSGPSAFISECLPDMNAFNNRACMTIPLYRDSARTRTNVTTGILNVISKGYRKTVTAEDLFSYAYAVLVNPGYVNMFWEELSTPGPRLPVTKNATLFRKVADLGHKLIWLHTFGNRMVPKGKRAGEVPQGKVRCLKAISQTEKAYPEEIAYRTASKEIEFGTGRFGPVEPEIWEFEVSGLKVVQSWLAHRRRSGAGKRSSPLDKIRPTMWTAQLTEEFLEMLWVLQHTVALYPDLQRLLDEAAKGDCFLASDFPQPTAAERKAPQIPDQRRAPNHEQAEMAL
jgi:hypothetical protein